MTGHRRCENCGRRRKLHALALRPGRPPYHVCAGCIEKIARGVAQVERAVRRAA